MEEVHPERPDQSLKLAIFPVVRNLQPHRPQFWNLDRPAVTQPGLMVTQLLGNLACALLPLLLRHGIPGRGVGVPSLELVSGQPLRHKRHRKFARVFCRLQLAWVDVPKDRDPDRMELTRRFVDLPSDRFDSLKDCLSRLRPTVESLKLRIDGSER